MYCRKSLAKLVSIIHVNDVELSGNLYSLAIYHDTNDAANSASFDYLSDGQGLIKLRTEFG